MCLKRPLIFTKNVLFKIILYNLKLIKTLKYIIFDIIVIFVCMKLLSCTVSALLKTTYSGLGLTVVTVPGDYFSQKYFFL